MEKRKSILDMFDSIKRNKKENKSNEMVAKDIEPSILHPNEEHISTSQNEFKIAQKRASISFISDDSEIFIEPSIEAFKKSDESRMNLSKSYSPNTSINCNGGDVSFPNSHTNIYHSSQLNEFENSELDHTIVNNDYSYSDNYQAINSSNAADVSVVSGRYSFLVNVRDKSGLTPDQYGYDPTSLFIPPEAYKLFTSFERQFWDIKKDHYDTVIFFKKGKFYELYENDAEIASKYFDMKVSDRVNMKMSGFPESSYDIWAGKFLQKGFKIARVDQRENQIGKRLREAGTKGSKSIIERELKEIITQGTIYNNDYLDSAQPIYIGAIVSNSEHSSTISDLNNFNPADNNIISTDMTTKCLTSNSQSYICQATFHFSILLYDASINRLFFRTFCDDLDMSALKTIFVQNDIRELISEESLKIKCIKNLNQIKIVLNENFPITDGFTEKCKEIEDFNELKCYMLLYKYFTRLNRQNILEMADIQRLSNESKIMQLDGSVIENMDILKNNFDCGSNFTLFNKINHCSTPFGTRLLKRWLLTPLIQKDLILERQQRAKIILENQPNELAEDIKRIGDIERFFGKLNNSSATLKDLRRFINSLSTCCEFFEKMQQIFAQSKSQVEDLKFFKNNYFDQIQNILSSFNSNYSISDKSIQPVNSSDELYKLTEEFQDVENALNEYLQETSKRTSGDLKYKSINKDIYQIEADSSVSMPSEFYINSATKTTKRYYSKDLLKFVNLLKDIEEKIFQSQGGLLSRSISFLKTFSHKISEIINYISVIDCYISITIFNQTTGYTTPTFVDYNDQSISDEQQANFHKIVIKNMTNPIYSKYIKNDFIPSSSICLITGPNMGGKSTFLRSVCLNIILAQVGFNVSADLFQIPIFDQIFTRIGASDSLSKGESTFMMEMNEAAKIMNKSTCHTFVAMDELGRGTSTKDGEAIARAVLDELGQIGCFTLFSTHYHQLVSNYKISNNRIPIIPGISVNSHGLYVARLAGIPECILQRAKEIRNNLLKED